MLSVWKMCFQTETSYLNKPASEQSLQPNLLTTALKDALFLLVVLEL